jgi:hypothetical protein
MNTSRARFKHVPATEIWFVFRQSPHDLMSTVFLETLMHAAACIMSMHGASQTKLVILGMRMLRMLCAVSVLSFSVA